jgi:hypothetical protein
VVENDALRWTLTAALSVGTAYYLFRVGRKSPLVMRVNYCLHALMTGAMISMLVPGWQWPQLPQVVIFTLAAWWFILQAVARREYVGICQGHARQRTCLYHGMVMAAMAYMAATMNVSGTLETPGDPIPEAYMAQAHHHSTSGQGMHTALSAVPDWTSHATFVLALVFSAAVALWSIRLAQSLCPQKPAASAQVSNGLFLRSAGFSLELVSASAMAVIFGAQVA